MVIFNSFLGIGESYKKHFWLIARARDFAARLRPAPDALPAQHPQGAAQLYRQRAAGDVLVRNGGRAHRRLHVLVPRPPNFHE